MKKSELKQLVKEVIGEVEKYGEKRMRAVVTRDFKDEMGGKHKKGESLRIDGIAADGTPYVIAGHGMDIGYPKDAVKIITSQSQLPPQLSKRFTGVKRLLNALINDRSRYYSDVLTDDFVQKFVNDIKQQLDTLLKTKSPNRN